MTNETKELIITVLVFILPVVLVMGAIGNIFSFIIFSRDKFRKTSFSLYFRVLAFSDTFTLLYIINDIPNVLYGQDLQNRSYFWCKTFRYWLYAIAPVSGWLLVVISLDRMLSIIRPNKFLFLKKKQTQATICFVNLAYNLIFYIPLIVYKDYQEQENLNSSNLTEIIYKCVNLEQEKIVDWLDLFNSTILPFLIMAISTSITVTKLFKSRSKTTAEAKPNTKLKQRDTKFAITSVALNLFFFIFNLPVCVLYLLADFIYIEDVDYVLIFCVTLITYYLNFGVVFYVNLVTNSMFRNELLVFLRLRKANTTLVLSNSQSQSL